MAEVTYAKQFLTLLERYPVKLSSDYIGDPRQLPAQAISIIPRNPKPYTKPTTTPTTTSIFNTNDTLPAATKARTEPSTTTSTSYQTTLTITLKPLRQPPNPLTLRSVPTTTSIYDIKARCARRSGYAAEKLKILWERKPVADSKTVGEVVGEERVGNGGAGEVEMGIMYMGASTAEPVGAEEEEWMVGSLTAGVAVAAAAVASVVGEGDIAMKDANTDAQQTDGSPPVAQGASGDEVLQTKEFWDDLRDWIGRRVEDEEVAAGLFRGFRESWRTGGKGS